MIASVVVTMNEDLSLKAELFDAISRRPEFDVGPHQDASCRIPVGIDTDNRHQMEAATSWLQAQPGVLSVDVVFVHLDQIA